jgi:8-oxo-dGTP pyrophosphatase MutT (NUDIX family)
MPNRWEVPGGAVDDEDESILHGVARELWEESGLKLNGVEQVVGLRGEDGYLFQTRRQLKVFRFSFVVDVEFNGDGRGEVTLDPNEHQRFLWASEEECRRKKVENGGEVVDVEFTTEAQEKIIMEGFRLRKEVK